MSDAANARRATKSDRDEALAGTGVPGTGVIKTPGTGVGVAPTEASVESLSVMVSDTTLKSVHKVLPEVERLSYNECLIVKYVD